MNCGKNGGLGKWRLHTLGAERIRSASDRRGYIFFRYRRFASQELSCKNQYWRHRAIAQLVARMLWEHQVAGSSPASPTNDQHCARHSLDVCKRARFDTLVDLSISAVDVSKTETNLTASKCTI